MDDVVGVLGPLLIGDGGSTIGSTKERAVVELLAVRVPLPVSDGELVGALWGDDPPVTATKTLQSLVSRLRRSVPQVAVQRAGAGYRLQVDPGRVDARRFERLAAAGRQALANGDPARAVEVLSSAQALWRGSPVPDLAGGTAAVEAVRLEELFRAALEDLTDARLAMGQHAAVIADLQTAVAGEPLRERRWAQLSVALYRDGRRAEALRTLRRARDVLKELGLDPGAVLVELEHSILADDAALRHGSSSAAPSRLPTWMTTFIGRHDELTTLAKRIREHRLVTVTGPGGVGKTRFAVEAAAGDIALRALDGVWFVDLAGIAEPDAVPGVAATTLGVKDDPVRDLPSAVVAHCATLDALLVLDNCEHVIDGVALLVRRLLADARKLRVLITSREPLGLPGEIIVRLQPLSAPPMDAGGVGEIADADAVRLFVDRAAVIDADFALDITNASAVASLCRRLDGLPLAIELAAAQIDVLGPAQIEHRLGEPSLLRSTERDGPSRHRSLDQLISWSYDLLADADQLALDRLAVFRGSFSLDAIEAVVTDAQVPTTRVLETLTRLVRRSLVIATGAGTDRRYRLLETIRSHGHRRLAITGQLDTWRNRHLDWVLDLATGVTTGLARSDQHDPADWLVLLDGDLDNVDEALAWSALDPARAQRALPVVIGLFNYWMARGTRRGHGIRWCSTLADAATAMDAATRTEAYLHACFLALNSDLAAGEALAASAERLAERTGDQRAAATAAVATGMTGLYRGDAETLRAATNHPLDVLNGFTRILAEHNIGWMYSLENAHAAAYEHLTKVVDAIATSGDEHMAFGVASTVADVGYAAGIDHQTLNELCRHALAVADRFRCVSCEAVALTSLVLVDHCQELGGRVAAVQHAVALAHDIRESAHVMLDLGVLVGVIADTGDVERAAFLAGGIETMRTQTRYAHCLPGRRHCLDTGVAAARAALGDKEFQRWWARGRRLGYNELIPAALAQR